MKNLRICVFFLVSFTVSTSLYSHKGCDVGMLEPFEDIELADQVAYLYDRAVGVLLDKVNTCKSFSTLEKDSLLREAEGLLRKAELLVDNNPNEVPIPNARKLNIIKNIGNCLRDRNLFNEADTVYQRGFQFVKTVGTSLDSTFWTRSDQLAFLSFKASLFLDWGKNRYEQDDIFTALNNLTYSWELYEQVNTLGVYALDYYFQTVAGNLIVASKNKLLEADIPFQTDQIEFYYRESLIRMDSLKSKYGNFEKPDLELLSGLHHNFATYSYLQFLLGEDVRPEEIISQFEQVINDANGSKYNKGLARNNLGFFYQNEEILDISKALSALQDAEKYLLDRPESPEVLPLVYTNMARAYRSQGNFEKALEHHRKAFEVANISLDSQGVPLIDSESLYSIQAPPTEIAEWLTQYAVSYQERAHREGHSTEWLVLADSILKLAVFILQETQRGFVSEKSKLFIRQKAYKTYEKAIEVSIALGNNEQAFYYAELAKAGFLYAAIQKHMQGNIQGVSKDTLAKERAWVEKEKFLLDRSSVEEIYRDSLMNHRMAFRSFLKGLKSEYPQYYASKYERKVPTIKDIQGAFSPDQGMVYFFQGEKNVYTFTITGDRFEVKKSRAFPRYGCLLYSAI